MRNILYYLSGTLLGIAIVTGLFYLRPSVVEALRTDESNIKLVSDTDVRQLDAEINECRKNAITHAVKELSPAVVGINVISVREYRYRSPFYNDPFFRRFFPDQVYRKKVENLGSGFIISPDGYILTNEHVVHAATQIIVTMTNEQKYDANIIGFDYDSDIALLKIDGKNLPFIPFGNSDDVIIGEWAIAIGNPFGLFSIHSQPTVTVGVISAIDRDFQRNHEGRLYQDMIQTDASINRGNSGGPLVNSAGELIGMNTMIFSEGGGSIGLGFTIPSNKLLDVYTKLKDRGAIERDFSIGLLGILNVNRVIAMSLRLPELRGVVITDVEKGSPAEKSGAEPTDVILAVNDKQINNSNDIEQILRNTDLRVGDILKLSVFRNGKIVDLDLKLEKRKK